MAVTKSESDGSHPSSHYLVVENPSKSSTWHLRVKNVSGKLDHTLMGAAWAALHGGYRGNKYTGPDKAEAISKLKKLYKQEGMTPPGTKSWVLKDKSGQQWFLGVYSNNFEDREDETFSWDSHVEYAKWVKDTGVKLPITVAHQPKYPPELHAAMLFALSQGTFTAKEFSDKYLKLYQPIAFAQTETIIPLKGFTLVLGKILEGKEKVVELINGWGMSHGFLTLDRDSEDSSVITQYRSFEFTTLPPLMAANMLTASSIKDSTMDATKGLSVEDREKLKEILNDPDALEGNLAEMQEIFSQVFNSKEIEPEEVETTDYEEVRDKIFAELNVEQMQKSWQDMVETIKSLETRIVGYEARLKEAERSEDEKIAEQLTPSFNWSTIKSVEEDEPEEEEKEALKEKALGDKPLPNISNNGADKNSPFQFMWNAMGQS